MNQIKYINKSQIRYKDNKKYLIKQRKVDIEDIYSNLKNRGFTNYIKPYKVDNQNEIYPYIDELKYNNSDKSKDIIYLSSLLHNKTTHFESIDIDKLKERYEETIKKLDSIYNYYIHLQDEIEEHIYMSPAELLLMNNISKVYTMLNLSRNNIEKYYKLSEEKSSERKVLLHGNLQLSHILESDNKYLISWNNAKIDLPVYDFVKFYRNDFENIEIESLYKEYQSKYQYSEEEKHLFFSLINIPQVVLLNKTNYIDTINVRKLVDYLDKTISFTLKENKEKEESDK